MNIYNIDIAIIISLSKVERFSIQNRICVLLRCIVSTWSFILLSKKIKVQRRAHLDTWIEEHKKIEHRKYHQLHDDEEAKETTPKEQYAFDMPLGLMVSQLILCLKTYHIISQYHSIQRNVKLFIMAVFSVNLTI